MKSDKNQRQQARLARRNRMRLVVLVATAVMTCSLSLWARPDDAIPYPAGYREWVHVKTALVGPKSAFFANSGGIHHLYANDKAMEGYRTGRFPDGAVVVADFLETQEPASLPGITAEGPRRRLDVMMKDSQRFAATGGWGFESFRGDSRTDRTVTKEAAAQCFACHASQKERDYVFSTYRK